MGRFFIAQKQGRSMTIYPTDIHLPADQARTQTNEVAHCQVCGTEWQVRSGNRDDAQGCSLCDAPASAVTVVSEAPGYEGELV